MCSEGCGALGGEGGGLLPPLRTPRVVAGSQGAVKASAPSPVLIYVFILDAELGELNSTINLI